LKRGTALIVFGLILIIIGMSVAAEPAVLYIHLVTAPPASGTKIDPLLVELASKYTTLSLSLRFSDKTARDELMPLLARDEGFVAGYRMHFVPAVYGKLPSKNLEHLNNYAEIISVVYAASGQVDLFTVPDDPAPEKAYITYRDIANFIGAPAAWSRGFTGAGIKVGVIDTGIDPNHPCLKGKVASEFTAAQGGSLEGPQDIIGHGTAVAASIVCNPLDSPYSSIGVAKDAAVLNAKATIQVLSLTGMAMYGSEGTMSAAAEWAIEQGADVLTMSLGLIPDPIVSGWWCNQPYIPTALATPLAELVKIAAEKGIPWFAAAGNRPIVGCVIYPSSISDFITVGTVSVTWKGGDHVLEGDASPFPLNIEGKPEIVAPGGMWDGRTASGWACVKIIPGLPCSPKAVYEVVRIATSWNSQFDQKDDKTDGWGYGAGTSISTPVAAGVAALVQQYLGGHQAGNVEKIKILLFDNAKDIEAVGRDQLTGFGRVDADKSLPAIPIPIAPETSWILVIAGLVLVGIGGIIRRREE